MRAWSGVRTPKGSFSRKCGSTIFTYIFFAHRRQFVSVFICPLAKLRMLYIVRVYTESPRYTDNNDDDMVDLDFFFL